MRAFAPQPGPAECLTCASFNASDASDASTGQPEKGQCRFRAPITDIPGISERARWPLVQSMDWCGDHERAWVGEDGRRVRPKGL